MIDHDFRALFVLPPERLFECYSLESEQQVLDAFLIYDHFYHQFPPGMLEERAPLIRRYAAALALQRLQEQGDAIGADEIDTIYRYCLRHTG